MKNTDFKEKPPCLYGDGNGVDLHEIVSGQGVRQVSIKYNLQVALCPIHHRRATLQKHRENLRICRILGLDYDKLQRIVHNKIEDKWTTKEKEYVIECGERIKRYYKRWL